MQEGWTPRTEEAESLLNEEAEISARQERERVEQERLDDELRATQPQAPDNEGEKTEAWVQRRMQERWNLANVQAQEKSGSELSSAMEMMTPEEMRTQQAEVASRPQPQPIQTRSILEQFEDENTERQIERWLDETL